MQAKVKHFDHGNPILENLKQLDINKEWVQLTLPGRRKWNKTCTGAVLTFMLACVVAYYGYIKGAILYHRNEM